MQCTIMPNHHTLLVHYWQVNTQIPQHISTERDIDKFLGFYRDSFPKATVTPKHHMLEDHAVPFLARLGVGLGFLREHGAKSIHARFNSIRRNYTCMPI